MAVKDKKAAERVRALALLRQLEIPADGLQDREPPDFILSYENGIIGIEVTVLVRDETEHGQSVSARDSEQNLVVDRAKELYIQASGVPIHVTVFFNNRRIDRKSRNDVAQWICNLVQQKMPEPND